MPSSDNIIRELRPTHTCFDDALDYLALIALAAPWTLERYTLVHGVCLTPWDAPYVHGWVEHGNFECVSGWLHRDQLVYCTIRRRDFYAEYRPQVTTRYTPAQAYRENLRTGHYGPWETSYREMILNDNKAGTRTWLSRTSTQK